MIYTVKEVVALDIHVFWVDDLVAAQVKPHTHDFYQLTFCKKRGGNISIGETKYEAKEGFIYLATPFTSHAMENHDGMQILEVKFIADEETGKKLDTLPPVFNLKSIDFAEEMLRLCVSEGMKGENYFREAVNYSFRLFFISILRAFSGSVKRDKNNIFRIPENADENRDIMILNLKYYMEDHLSEAITLDSLADTVHFNKSYFVKRFKLLMGASPMKYLNTMRIERSKQLLRQTELSISEIAAKTGFPSPHYFSRLFKAHVGIPPKDFRNQKEK